MALVETISAELGTRAYVWGGWSLDICRGSVTREHSDIDCLAVDLYPTLVGLCSDRRSDEVPDRRRS